MSTNIVPDSLHSVKQKCCTQSCCYKSLIGGLLCLFSIQPLRWQPYLTVPENIENISGDFPFSSFKQGRPLGASRRHPRIIQYDVLKNEAFIPQSNSTYILQPPGVSHKIAADGGDGGESTQGCQFMHDWQTRIYPSCNNAHEINMRPETGSVVFINCETRCCYSICNEYWESIRN